MAGYFEMEEGVVRDNDKRGFISVSTGGVASDLGQVCVLVREGSTQDMAGVMIDPSEARALAALLLKHADRAEGKT